MKSENKKSELVKCLKYMIEHDLKGRGIRDERVIEVMEEVRREEFVPASYESDAYSDGPLPIGLGQTISQPYIVALMTEQLMVNSACEVLEIGTGSGYQTAILSKLAKKVHTIERYSQLSESAQAVLGRLGIKNVEFCVGDGSCGWPEQKVFDRIMVTAAVPEVPEALVEQLKTGGLMIVPIGRFDVQKLMLVKRESVGTTEQFICDVRFVRLVGEYGFAE